MVRFAILVGVLTVLSGPAVAGAQEPVPDATRMWVSAGLGGGLFSSLDGQPNDPGIALLAALVVKQSRHRVALRGTIVAEVLGDGVVDLGVLYGRTWSGARSETSLSAGAALVHGEDCHGLFGGSCDPVTTAGLPLSVTVSWRPSRILGLGLEGFANLNSLSSFVGVVGMLELGALR